LRTPNYYQGSSGDWYYSVILNYDAGSDTYSFEKEGPFSNYYEARAAWAYTEEQRDAVMEGGGW
tara:strand:+ start:4075 stop:4266 length:192 start_codon:yes stop_codon:yes gene_type:complete